MKGRYQVRFATFVAAGCMMVLMAAPAFGSVPISMTQQGKLVDADGEPMTGTQSLEFAIYDAPQAGAVLWSDVIDEDLGDDGVYTVTLGDEAQPIDADLLLAEEQLYLGLTVGDEEMSPRLELTSVPFAAVAQRAEYADYAGSAEIAAAVEDGAIDSQALAPDAVGVDAIDSIRWDQIDNVPSEVTDPTDTLAELNCSSDELAVYDGSNWVCTPLPSYSGSDFALADQACPSGEVAVGITTSGNLQCSPQQDTTYSAGDGLQLSGSQFSVNDGYFDGYFDGQYHAVGEDVDVGANDVLIDGDGGNLEINYSGSGNEGSVTMGHFGSSSTTYEPLFRINQQWTGRGMTMERTGDIWRIGTSVIGPLRFAYDDDGGDNNFSSLAEVDPDDGSWVTLSDQRYKTDVEPIEQILDRLLQLEPATYRMDHVDDEETRSYGFMAQQVAELFPDVVRYAEDTERYGLAYADFAVLSVQAIREQQEVIDTQRDEIEQLQGQLDSMEQRLQRLEQAQELR